MLSTLLPLLTALAVAADDDAPDRKTRHSLHASPLVGVTTWRPPSADSNSVNAYGGFKVGYDFVSTSAVGIAGESHVAYTGIVGSDRKGRELRFGAVAGPRFGTEAGKLTELSVSLFTGFDLVRDTYFFRGALDPERAPQALLVDVPFHARVVLTVVELQAVFAPSWFVDRQVGSVERAPTERANGDVPIGHELEWGFGAALRLGKRFRLGVTTRTRQASYGTLTRIGLGAGLGVGNVRK